MYRVSHGNHSIREAEITRTTALFVVISEGNGRERKEQKYSAGRLGHQWLKSRDDAVQALLKRMESGIESQKRSLKFAQDELAEFKKSEGLS